MAAAWNEDDRPKRLDLRVWWQILAKAWPYRVHAAALSAVAILIAVCEVLFPYLTGRIVDHVTQAGSVAGLARLGAWYLVVTIAICLGILTFILLAGRIASGVGHDIRLATFAKLQELSFSYYDRRPVGRIMARLTSDCDRLSRIIGWTLLDFIWAVSMVLGISAVMLYLNLGLALVVLSVAPPLAIASAYFQGRLLRSARAVRRVNGEITGAFNENIMGVRTTKALVRETENLDEFQALSSQMYSHSVRNALDSALFVPIVIALGSTMAGLALWYGGGRVLLGSLSLGTLITFMNYSGLFFHPIQEFARQFMEVQMAQAAAERIQRLLDTEPEIKDSPQVLAQIRAAESNGSADLAPDGGRHEISRIEFRDVTFAYDEQNILESFSLAAESGETIALVGATGGGKTTIVNLLCRFYEPTAGEILIDGVEYRQRSLHWLQSNLGMVLQAPHLFSGTIRENIRYGNLRATDDEVVAAARLVNADDFIRQLSEGYETEVGEGGGRLSTGQKQLVALSRAILADPQLFVLDEATSSVDTETEQLIEGGIQRVLRGRISFVIAHRLSTIRNADRILVIEQGRIAEAGTHDELLQHRGRYHELHSRQFLWSGGV